LTSPACRRRRWRRWWGSSSSSHSFWTLCPLYLTNYLHDRLTLWPFKKLSIQLLYKLWYQWKGEKSDNFEINFLIYLKQYYDIKVTNRVACSQKCITNYTLDYAHLPFTEQSLFPSIDV
jgi:hypothetical protein